MQDRPAPAPGGEATQPAVSNVNLVRLFDGRRLDVLVCEMRRGQVLALQLNVDFSNKGLLPTGLANLKVVSGPMAGQTVQQVLTTANNVLGGAAPPSGMTISDVNNVVDAINNNFDDGSSNHGYLSK